MNPKQTYINNFGNTGGGGSWGGSTTTPKKKVNFGLSLPNSLGSLSSMTMANSTNPYPKGITPPTVNSTNPTAGNITPSYPGATGTNQGSNTPASTTSSRATTLPPAGVDYAKTLAQISSGLQGLSTSMKTPAPEPKKEESEYLKYLRSMFNPDEAKRAQENVNALNKKTADEVARNRKEQERIQKNEAGMIERGQNYLSTNEDRASAKALADLAIAKGYNTDILNQFTTAGKSLYEAEQAAEAEANTTLSLEEAQILGVPFGTTIGEARLKGIIPQSGTAEDFTLSEGQARFDSSGNLIASRGKTYAPGTSSSSTSGSNSIVGADGKPLKLSATQVDSIAGFDNTISGAERALALLNKGVSTGPVEGRLLQAAKFTGGGNPEQLQLEQLLGKLKADFMKALSGAAVSEQEAVRLAKFLPDINDQENVIASKLNTLISESLSSKDNFLNVLGAQPTSSNRNNQSQPQQMKLPNGTIVTLQADGTYQ